MVVIWQTRQRIAAIGIAHYKAIRISGASHELAYFDRCYVMKMPTMVAIRVDMATANVARTQS